MIPIPPDLEELYANVCEKRPECAACPVCLKKPTTGVSGQRLLVPPLWVKSERMVGK